MRAAHTISSRAGTGGPPPWYDLGRRSRRSARWRWLVALAACGLAARPAAAARTWMVDDDRAECPKADFTTVGAAAAAAANGDTIRICPGLYRENITVTNKSLIFQGDGVDRVLIDGNRTDPTGIAASTVNVFTLRSDNGVAYTCRFVGLTIRHGKYGILAQGAQTGQARPGSNMAVDVANCVFIHNGYDGVPYGATAPEAGAGYSTHATDGGGVRGEGDGSRVVDSVFEENDRSIQFDFARQLQVTGNQMRGNLQPGINLGRRRQAGQTPAVSDVVIRGNTVNANLDTGIRVSGGVGVRIEANVVTDNWNSGVVIYDGDTVTLNQNRIAENGRLDTNGLGSIQPESFGGVGIIEPVGSIAITNNDIRANHPGFSNLTVGGVRLTKSSTAAVTLTGNTIFANDGDGVLLEGNGAGVRINQNNITSNRLFGVNNRTTATVDAARNWWASANGPSTANPTADNPEQVAGRLVVRPWATTPFAYPAIRLTPAP